MTECACWPTPPEMWTTHYGATEPGSMYQWNPDCPAHPPQDDLHPVDTPGMLNPTKERGRHLMTQNHIDELLGES